MLFSLNILQTFVCSNGFVPNFSNGEYIFKTAVAASSVMINIYFLCFISPSDPFPFCFDNPFFFVYYATIILFLSQLGKLRMSNGEMVSTNQKIYLNPDGKIEKHHW